MPAPTTLVFASTRHQALRATDELGLPRNRAYDYGSMDRALRGRGAETTAVVGDGRLTETPVELKAAEASGVRVIGLDEAREERS